MDEQLPEFDRLFKFEILCYITEDAERAQIVDDLVDALAFAPDPAVSVRDMGTVDNHLAGAEGTVHGAGSAIDASAGVHVAVDGAAKHLQVDIDDCTSLRGHWVEVEFAAGLDGDELADAGDLEAAEVHVSDNGTVITSIGEHDGIPNDASYLLAAGDYTYQMTSEVVTVSPPEQPEQPDEPGTPEPGKPQLQSRKTVDKAVAQPGDELVYTIELRNVGDADAMGVHAKDYVPECTTFVACGGDGQGRYGCTADGREFATWFVPVLAAGERATLTMTVKVNECNDATLIRNVARTQVTGGPDRPSDGDEPSTPTDEATTQVSLPKAAATPHGTPARHAASAGRAPKTGDELQAWPLLALAAASGAVAVAAGRRRGRR